MSGKGDAFGAERVGSDALERDGGRSVTAEAIMITVRLNEAPLTGDSGRSGDSPSTSAPDVSWRALDELASATLRLARHLREGQGTADATTTEKPDYCNAAEPSSADLPVTEPREHDDKS